MPKMVLLMLFIAGCRIDDDKIQARLARLDEQVSEAIKSSKTSSDALKVLAASTKLVDFRPNWYCGPAACARSVGDCRYIQSRISEVKDDCIARRVAYCTGVDAECFLTLDVCRKFSEGKQCIGVE